MNEDIILRFLNKKADDSDLREVDKWISESNENAKWLFGMEEIWSLKNELKYSDKREIERAYYEFLKKTGQISEQKSARKIKPVYWKIAAVAAAVAIIALLSIDLLKMASLEDSYYSVNANINVNEIDVPKGQTVTLTLSDGTKVWLNADTKFIYPSKFSSKNRIVKIIGEGFFEVEHNKESPFVVQSGDVSTTVLGTKFNVKAYAGEQMSITLLEGIIEVSRDKLNDKIRLDKPNQQVAVLKKGFMKKDNVDAYILSQWTTGELYFADEPLTNIANTLGRRFDINININSGKLASTIFNSRIQKDATLIDILNILKETRKLDYTINGKQVYLTEHN